MSHGAGKAWRLALAAALLGLLTFAILSAQLAPPAHAFGEGIETRRIADKLQCPVCQGQSVAESNSQVAEGMRTTIKDMLDEGRSEKEIVDFFVERYGAGVLREPPRSGLFSAVWWVPGIALVLGGGLVLGIVRQRRRSRTDVGGCPEPPPESAEDREYRERLRRDIESGGS